MTAQARWGAYWGIALGKDVFLQLCPHEAKIRAIKPSGKTERFYEQNGLYLKLSKAGGKLWRWKYRFEGKEKRLALGVYPDVTLAQARAKRDEARKVLKNGVDPGSQNRKKAVHTQGRTFESVAREWVDSRLPVWSQRPAETVIDRLVANVCPSIGGMLIDSVELSDVLAVPRKIEERRA